MDLVLLGAPGSGKGTQAGHLRRELALTHIASGDLFRDHLQRSRCTGEHLYQRADDAPETVRARLATYHRQTAPVIDYYRLITLLITVPGDGSLDDVKQATLDAVRRFEKER